MVTPTRTFNLKVLVVLSLGHLVTDIYQGALPAVLPFLKERLSLSYTMAGVLMMTSNLTSSVIQPLFGYISDRKQKAAFLPLGCFCAGLGFSLLALPETYTILLLLVVLSGLGVASYHPEGYKTAYFFTGDRMATGMSIFAVGGNLGFAVGPILSLWIITHLGFSSLPVIITPALLFLGLIAYFWRMIALPTTSTASQKAETSVVEGGAYLSLSLLITSVVMRSWTQIGLMTYIPFYYIDHLRGDPLYAGKLVSVFLLGGVVGTLGGSPIADRWGHKQFLMLSLFLTTLILPLVLSAKGVVLFPLIGTLGMVLISSFTVTIVMAQRLLPKSLGIASGLMVGFAIGTGGMGVTILGVIADRFGVPFALRTIALLPLVGFLVSLFIRYPAGGKS